MITRIFENLAKRFTQRHPPRWFVEYIGGGESSAGVAVSEVSALKYTPFWAAVRIISGTLASLPFMIYQRLETGGKIKQNKHRVYRLLHDWPNEYMDSVTFIETRQAHVLTYGNGYAEIQRDGAGRPVKLWPLLPDRTQRKISDGGIPYYEVRVKAAETVALPEENVLHIKGLGFDGYTGYPVVDYHRDAIGYGIAVKEYGARFFANGAAPGGVLEHPDHLSNEGKNRLKEAWTLAHKGLSNAHRIAVLEEGLKWNRIGIEPDKAQALEVQEYTVDDCARIFNIPPHKLGSMEHSKYNNVEQLNLDFYMTTMLYWFRKWELEINRKLFMPSEQGRLFAEILVDAMLRGNMENRTQYYTAGRQWGYLSINDIRAKENMNPIGPEGDVYLDPMNMTPAGTLPAQQIPDSDKATPSDDARVAYRDLMASGWQRIVTKQIRANGRKTDAAWWERHRDWAREVLIDAVRVYAAAHDIAVERAIGALTEILDERLGPDRAIGESQTQELAELLLNRIGDSHALAET